MLSTGICSSIKSQFDTATKKGVVWHRCDFQNYWLLLIAETTRERGGHQEQHMSTDNCKLTVTKVETQPECPTVD